jgi:ATP-binding cassette, subfamily B, bacterial MsbA
MHSLRRVLQIVLSFKVTLVSCVLSAAMVAMLWAASLSGVFPVVEVIMTGRAIPDWVGDNAQKYQAKADEYAAEAAELEKQFAAVPADSREGRKLSGRLHDTEIKQEVYQRIAVTARVWLPWSREHLPATPFGTLAMVCVVVLVATVVRGIFRVINEVLVARLASRVGYQLRKQYYGHLLELDLRSFASSERGDLMSRCTNDINAVSQGMRAVFGKALLEPFKMVACLMVAAWISWQLLLLTLIVVPLSFYMIHLLAKALRSAHRRALEELSTVLENLTETLSGMKLIKAFNKETMEEERFNLTAHAFYKRQMKTERLDALVSPSTEMVGMGMILLAAITGGYLVLNQQTHVLGIKISNVPLTHGMMSVFFAMMAGISDPARRLTDIVGKLQHTTAAAERVFEVLDRQPSIVDPAVPAPLPHLTRSLKFEGVGFYYSQDHPVLQQLDLEVRAGETLAIMGPNGCGKSTLLNLVPRFDDPQAGKVTIDGVDLRSVRVSDLRRRIGLVNQEALLLNDTVAANIAYGNPEATREQIEAAAHKAHAFGFITEKLEAGFETMVGPSGNRLSGGQRQRVALARAILREPEILLLDEATSQIDVESEQLIHQVLQEFVRGRTVLMITHRMSSVALADRVAVMDQGRIVDVGTHEQLLGRCELYARLANGGLTKRSA